MFPSRSLLTFDRNSTSAQRKRWAPTVRMLSSGGATTLILIADGADAVSSFVMRSKPPGSYSWSLTTRLWRTNTCGRKRRIQCCSGTKWRGIRWLEAWLEQHFRVTEAFDANSEDVTVWWSTHHDLHRKRSWRRQFLRHALIHLLKLIVPLDNATLAHKFLRRKRRIPCCSGKKWRGFRWLETWLEQHFRVTEAFDPNSDDVTVCAPSHRVHRWRCLPFSTASPKLHLSSPSRWCLRSLDCVSALIFASRLVRIWITWFTGFASAVLPMKEERQSRETEHECQHWGPPNSWSPNIPPLSPH